MSRPGPWGPRPTNEVLWEPEKIDLVVRGAVARNQTAFEEQVCVRLALFTLSVILPVTLGGMVLFALFRMVNQG